MIRYFLYRLLALLPKLLIISMIIFLGLQLVPGDPITRSISPEVYAKLSPAQLEEMRTKLGLNDPLALQYLRWLGGVLRGDFGYSLATGGRIADMIAQRLPATFELATFSLAIATVFGLLFGFVSAVRHNTILDRVNTVLGMLGVSVPEFFFGLCAILVFALYLKWFPTGGRMEFGREGFFDRIRYLVLPACCLGISLIATLMRYTRGSMLDVLGKDYIKAARSKGLSEWNVNLKHGLRNALIPIMVILVFRIPMLVGGTVVIETVFNFPGMGSMLMDAISGSDMPVVMIATLIISCAILAASFLVDLFTAVLDPRIRFGAR